MRSPFTLGSTKERQPMTFPNYAHLNYVAKTTAVNPLRGLGPELERD
jgi:hypothetical protein